MDTKVNKKLFILLAFLLAIFIISYVTYLFYGNRSMSLYATPVRLPQPLNSTVTNNGDMVFSNGRYFVEYNPTTNKSQPLGSEQQLPLPNIANTTVSKNGKYILFQTIGQQKDDMLGSKFPTETVNTFGENDWWWIYDTDTQAYKSIDVRDKKNWIELGGDENITSTPPRNIYSRISTDGKSIYTLVYYSDGTKHIVESDIKTLEILSDITVESYVDLFYVYKDRLILSGESKLYTINLDGTQKKQMKGVFAGVSNDGNSQSNTIIIYDSSGKEENQVSHGDIVGGNFKNIGKTDDESTQTVSNNGNFIGYKKNNKLVVSENGFIQKKYTIKIKNVDLVDTPSLDFVSILSKNVILAIDNETGMYYLLKPNDSEFQKIKDTNYSIPPEQCAECVLWYDVEAKKFTANIVGQPTMENKNLVYQILKRQDINLDRVYVEFGFFDSSNQSNLLTP